MDLEELPSRERMGRWLQSLLANLHKRIGKNARRFAAENLTMEALLNRTAEAVWQETKEKRTGRPSLNERAETGSPLE